MKTTITKKEILKALETEPLEQGHWVALEGLPTVGTCRVCAVGAVLRHCGLTNVEISEYAGQVVRAQSIDRNLTLEDGDWVSALSDIFERSGKKAAIRFVQERFPDKVSIDRKVLRDIRSRSLVDFARALARAEADGFRPRSSRVTLGRLIKMSHASRRKLQKEYAVWAAKGQWAEWSLRDIAMGRR